jgi:hypothetical protein
LNNRKKAMTYASAMFDLAVHVIGCRESDSGGCSDCRALRQTARDAATACGRDGTADETTLRNEIDSLPILGWGPIMGVCWQMVRP